MTERSRNIAVGLTALFGVLSMAGLMMLFGYVPIFMEKGYLVTVELPNASGLNPEGMVRLNGIDIGRIKEVKLDDASGKVHIVCTINEGVKIPPDVYVKVFAPMFGGTAALDFDLSKLTPEQRHQSLRADGTALLIGHVPTMAGEFARELQAAINGPAQDLAKVKESFTQLSDTWTTVGNDVHQLLEQRKTADVDAGKAAGNLTTVLARADQRLAEMQTLIKGVESWINDEQMRADIKATLANAKSMTANANEGVTEMRATMKDARVDINAVSKRYIAVADDLSGAVNELRETIAQAKKGEGTVGKLLNDPALYNNLNDAATRATKAMEAFKLLIEKWKAEGLPVQF
ncbi:MAG: MlaD family protein [Planctomycetes bacterium]|nr:MlaD family protein [Planctomycetota bacterium]